MVVMGSDLDPGLAIDIDIAGTDTDDIILIIFDDITLAQQITLFLQRGDMYRYRRTGDVEDLRDPALFDERIGLDDFQYFLLFVCHIV